MPDEILKIRRCSVCGRYAPEQVKKVTRYVVHREGDEEPELVDQCDEHEPAFLLAAGIKHPRGTRRMTSTEERKLTDPHALPPPPKAAPPPRAPRKRSGGTRGRG